MKRLNKAAQMSANGGFPWQTVLKYAPSARDVAVCIIRALSQKG